MIFARVIGTVVSTQKDPNLVQKHPAYHGKIVFVVQPVCPDGTDIGNEWVAVDYVGARIGDIVVCGGAPGMARTAFQLEMAPTRTLIMAIVDSIDYREYCKEEGMLAGYTIMKNPHEDVLKDLL